MYIIIKHIEDVSANFKIWYFSKPHFTRTYLTICTAVTLLITLKLLSPMTLIYTFQSTFFDLQIWRPFNALFFMGKFDLSFIFNIFFAYEAIKKVQTQVFSKEEYADFLWLTILLFLGCMMVGSLIDIYFFTEPFVMGLIYVWCKRLPQEYIMVLFRRDVKTGYYPFVYMIMMTILGGSFINYIVGIILGHIYIFVKDIAVIRYHKDYLPTPIWFTNWWFGGQSQRHNVGGQPQRSNVGGFFQGQGVNQSDNTQKSMCVLILHLI